MNITVNPIEINTQIIIKCKYCNEEFESQEILDFHILQKHKIELDDIIDELHEITLDIKEDKVISNSDKNSVINNSTITAEPTSNMMEPNQVEPSSNTTFCCCYINDSSVEKNYQQYTYRPEHNPEGCCDCEGVDCDNCYNDCANCEDCNWNACCRDGCDCKCCDDSCVLM